MNSNNSLCPYKKKREVFCSACKMRNHSRTTSKLCPLNKSARKLDFDVSYTDKDLNEDSNITEDILNDSSLLSPNISNSISKCFPTCKSPSHSRSSNKRLRFNKFNQQEVRWFLSKKFDQKISWQKILTKKLCWQKKLTKKICCQKNLTKKLYKSIVISLILFIKNLLIRIPKRYISMNSINIRMAIYTIKFGQKIMLRSFK